MRNSSRWQDVVALVAGAYAFLSPIWTNTVGKATSTVIVLGIITALVAVWALAKPGVVATEWLVGLLGVLFFISPWVIGFTGTTGMAWTAWVVGVVAFVAGATALPRSQHLHHALPQH